MRPNEIVELAMQRVYTQEAKSVSELVGDVTDALQACLVFEGLQYKGFELNDLRYQFQRLVYADAKNNEYDIAALASQQLVATALGYLILYHAGQ